VAEKEEPVAPCEICKHSLIEFGDEIKVIMANTRGDAEIATVAELLPRGFKRDHLDVRRYKYQRCIRVSLWSCLFRKYWDMIIMNRFNVTYLAFDQFVPSKHAGFVHSYSIAKAIKSIGNDVVLYGIPTGVELYNLTGWPGDYQGLNVNYVRFIVSFKSKYRPLYPLNIIGYYKILKNLQDQDPDIVDERIYTKRGIKRMLNDNGFEAVAFLHSEKERSDGGGLKSPQRQDATLEHAQQMSEIK